MVTLPPWPVSTDFGTRSYQCFLSNCTPVSLHMLKCSCAHTLSCLFMYFSFASMGHADILWSIVYCYCYYYYMSRACSTRSREEKFDEHLVEKLKEKEGLEDD